jgi:arylsulfatase A-like enzyme
VARPSDPFAPLVRKQRQRALLLNLRRRLTRPWRPSRLGSRREGPPNLVLIGVDTLRFDHSGEDLMPRLAGLAADGLRLDDVMAPSPWTLPSFAGALTGLMPCLHNAQLTGAVRNMDTQPPQRLRHGAVTLARHLAGRGYATCALYANQFFAFGLAETFSEHRYINLQADDLLDVALDWIRRHADRPFFCFVLLNDPHEPTTPAPDLLARQLATLDLAPPSTAELRRLTAWGDPARPEAHLGLCGWPLPDPARRARDLKRAVYRATVRQVDRAIGRFADQIDTWGLLAHTQVTVFSDHGEEFCDHAAEANAWGHDPRRVRGIGHGHTQFQELLHVPWMSFGPGVPPLGGIPTPVSLLDLAPTVAEWLGLGPFYLPDVDASGLVGRPLSGLGMRSTPGLSTTETGSRANGPRLRLAESIAFGPDLVALRRDNWKLIAHRDGRVLGLYDLVDDPRERNDQHAAEPDRLAALQAELPRWRRAVQAQAVSTPKDRSTPFKDGGAGGWDQIDDEVRRRLKELGYGE